tara:strand:+ start:1615 stop:2181 length:567 start_codon:yes stop_codon:yes gene_type:complete
MTNFTIGKDIDLTYDPTVCQSPQECAAQTIQKDVAQNNAAKAMTGGIRGRSFFMKKIRGGKAGLIAVLPLPQGSQTSNTAANNTAMAKTFASIQMNASNDSKVGGKRYKKKKSRKSRKSLKGGGRKTTCVKQTRKKYITRKSPPYPANKCKTKKRKGNDGKFYISKAKGGTYKWVPFAGHTKSKNKKN